MTLRRRLSFAPLALALLAWMPGSATAQLSKVGTPFGAPSGGSPYAKTVDAAHDSTHNAFLVVTTEHKVGHVVGSFASVDGTPIQTGGSHGFRIDTSGNFPFGPAMAYSGQADAFLVVWVNNSGQIRGRFVRYGAGPIGGDFQIGSGGRASWAPAVAYSKTSQEFLVSWSTGQGPNKAVRVTTSGATLGAPVQVTGNIWTQEPALAWNPANDEFLLTYATEISGAWRIYSQRIKGGQAVGGALSVHASGGTKMPDVAYSAAAGKYLVTWFQFSPYGIYGRLVNPDNSPANAAQPMLSSAYGSYDANSVDYNDYSDTFAVTSITNSAGFDAIGGAELSGSAVPNSPMLFVQTDRNHYYPEIAASSTNGRFLSVFNRSLSTFQGQMLNTASTGGGATGSGGGDEPPPPPSPPPPPPPSASSPAMFIDAPGAGATVPRPFVIAGWAIDKNADSGTGVDAVHVWAFPSGGGAGTFLGAAGYGIDRPDIAAAFGAQFRRSGWGLKVDELATGTWRLEAHLHSAVTGTFTLIKTVNVTMGGPAMSLDAPGPGASFKTPYDLHGWAIDRNGSGAGVSTVHVWAYPLTDNGLGSPRFIGPAEYSHYRTNVAAVYGDRFTRSGFKVTAMNVPPGTYLFAAFARSTATGTFNNSDSEVATVAAGPVMSVDVPSLNQTVGQPFSVTGWALDLAAASGTGVGTVHVWAYPGGGGSPVFLGAAAMNVSRPDVAALYGSRAALSGYALPAGGLPPGQWMVACFAYSSVTNTFSNAATVNVTVQ